MNKLFVVLIIGFLTVTSFGATWRGKNIDGVRFDAEIYSYSQAKFYQVQVKFKDDDCYIFWKNGGYIVVSLDDEKIEDIHNISAYHYKTASFYDIDVVDLD